MKASAIFALLVPVSGSFVIEQPPVVWITAVSGTHHKAPIEDIFHELEELNNKGIKPVLLKDHYRGGAGMGGYYHESLVHKLRHNLHEHQRLLKQAAKDMEKVAEDQKLPRREAIADLQMTLAAIKNHLQDSSAYALAWETAELELLEAKRNGAASDLVTEEAIQGLQESMHRIEEQLSESAAYAAAWKSAEGELRNERAERGHEHESVRYLLGQALKLIRRRVRNGVRRIFGLKKKD